MSSLERKTVLHLPLKIVLTEEGTDAFIRRNRTLAVFVRADGSGQRGLMLDKFIPSALQRLLLKGWVSGLELSRPGIAGFRQELKDLSKLIVYALLYRRCDSALFSRMLGSDPVRRWNQSNPGFILDERTRFNDPFLRDFLRENETAIAGIRTELLSPLREVITRNSNLLPDEMRVQLFLCENFLNKLRPVNWFILSRVRDAGGYDAIARDIRSCLSEYMEKSRIAEHAALMIVELAEELGNQGHPVSLRWKTDDGKPRAGDGGALRVFLSDGEPDYGEGPEKQNLTDFYRGRQDDKIVLGPYYLSYLEEACAKVGVKFVALAGTLSLSGATTVELGFDL